MKGEISGNDVQVKRKGGRVMEIVLTLCREVMRIVCAYGPQSGRPDTEKVRFYNKMASEWDFESSNEIIISLTNFNGHVGKCAEVFKGVHGGDGIVKRNAEGRRLLEVCDKKELCVANTWFYKADKRKITYFSSTSTKSLSNRN